MTNAIDVDQKADLVLMTGINMPANYPVGADRIKQRVSAGKLKLLYFDSRELEMAEHADLYAKPKMGTEVAWLNAMMHVIINEDLYDHEFVAERTEGFEELKRLVADYTPEKAAKLTGVPKEKIIEAARLYAQADRAAIIYGMGLAEHSNGTDNVSSACNLALLTGNLGKEGAGVNPIAKQNNGSGAGDMGNVPIAFPGAQPVSNPDIVTKFEQAWGTTLSDQPGKMFTDMTLTKGTVKGLYIMGSNPMRSDPNLNQVRDVFEAMDFVVVQDMFMSQTAEIADVVLPASSFAEKDGTFVNGARMLQRVRQAIEPVGNSLPDWKIICRLGERMGLEMDYNHPSEIMDEIASLAPPYGGVTYDRLEHGPLTLPCPTKDHPGTEYLWKEKFNTPSGKGIFFPKHYRELPEIPDKEYPFLLATGKLLCHMQTGSYTQQSRVLSSMAPRDLLEISPQDGKALELKDGDTVRIISRRGQISLPVKIMEDVDQGTVFTTFFSLDVPVNEVTLDTLDPAAKVPELKVCAVKLEKVA
jgi:predicted molibdopterin-dependent oxidoreductase YjgC